MVKFFNLKSAHYEIDTFRTKIRSKSMVNFTNILQATFTRADPQKKTAKLSVFFALSGSAHLKASSRKLMKLTPGVNFTDINAQRTFADRHCFTPFSLSNKIMPNFTN